MSLVFWNVWRRENLYAYDRHLTVVGRSRRASKLHDLVRFRRRRAGQLGLFD